MTDKKNMNPFERAIAAAVPSDPRKDAAQLDAIKKAYPRDTETDTGNDEALLNAFDGVEGVVPEDEVDAIANFLVNGGDESGDGAALSSESTTPEVTKKALPFKRKEPLVIEETQETQEEASAPKHAEEDKKQDKPKLEAKPPEGLPPAIVDSSHLFKVLDLYGLSEESAMEMLLSVEKPLSDDAKMLIWKQEVKMSGFEEKDIDKAIQEFISTGTLKRKFKSTKLRTEFLLQARSQEMGIITDILSTRLMRDTGMDYVTEPVQQRYSALSRAASSLVYYIGFGEDWTAIPKADESPMESMERATSAMDLLKRLNPMAFQQIATELTKLDQLVFLSAQKMAIENF